MATDPILENYLATLERILQPLSVSDRAEIVTEIKSHVLEALERGEPKPTLQNVLQSLGPPEQVANRYLMERKVSMAKPPIHSAVKWLFAGCFGAFALLILVAGFLAWKAMGVVEKLEEKNLSVNIDDKGIHVRDPKDAKSAAVNANLNFSNFKSHEVRSELALPPDVKTLSVDFKLGEVRFENSPNTGNISLDCTVQNELGDWKPELKLSSANEASLNCGWSHKTVEFWCDVVVAVSFLRGAGETENLWVVVG